MAKITYIPGEIANAAIDEHGNRKPVTRTQHIFDDAKNKSQAEVNAETEERVSTHAQQIADLQAMEQIVIDGGDAQIAQGSDFDNPDSAKRAKIPTVGAVLDGISEGVFNLTAKTGDSYASLQDALTAANTAIPANKKKGGMQLSFVQSSDNKYVQYRLMTDDWSTDTEDWSFCGNDVYIDNPEYIKAETDAEGHLLFWIKVDGSIDWAIGVPKPVKDYVDSCISEILNGNDGTNIDGLNKVITFLDDFTTSDTLKALLDTKVDKETGKSLIDEEYASTKSTIDNPEFLDVILDAEDKVLEGIQEDGTKIIGGDLNVGGSARILGNMEVSGVSYKVIENPEYLAAWIDASDKVIFGFKANGKTYVGDADFLNEIKNNQEAIGEIKSYLANFDNLDIDALLSITEVENPEFIEAKIDAEGKLLAGRTNDGAAFENVGFSTPEVSTESVDIDGHIVENIEDPEGRTEIKTDSDGKILSYRDNKGIVHENIGIETDSISTNHLNLPVEASKEIVKKGEQYDRNIITENPLNIPYYGSLNFITEDIPFNYQDNVEISVSIGGITDIDCEHIGYIQFGIGNSTVSWFETKHYISKEQVSEIISINAPTNVYSPAMALAVRFVPCVDGLHVTEDSVVTYTNVVFKRDDVIITTIPSLDIAITKIDGHYQESYSGDVYSINGVFGFIPTLNKWLVWNWQVSKKPEHRGQIVIDIPGYMNTTEYATIKFQGNSTLNDLKKSFRLTIYKDNTYNKKKKLKIGDMIELNGFNMKSFSNRAVRFNEPIAYRMVHMIWRSRDYIDQYPWNENHIIYTGSTGSIKQFPIKLSFNGEFYGVNFFGEKKDKTNYMLDGTDQSGMFLSFGSNQGDSFSNLNTFLSGWEDEMIDEDDPNTPWVNTTDRRTTQSNINALTAWFNYFNGDNFNKETAEQHFSKIDWIDYMIFVNVFCLQDNIANNIILYSNSNKTKFYPYIYDLDQALDWLATSGDIFTSGYAGYDMSLYNKLIKLWWEDIVERYWELRAGCLSLFVFTKIVNTLTGNTNYSDFEKEMSNWNLPNDKSVSDIISRFKQRLNFCDSFYKV